MRLIISVLYLLACLLYAHASSTHPKEPIVDSGICQRLHQHPQWINALKDTESKWGVPISVQLSIIFHESNFNPHAKNPNSSAYGFSQALNGTWKLYQRDNNPSARRDDFSASTDFIGWYADQMHDHLGIDVDNPYRLYIAYYAGSGAYKKAARHTNSLPARLASRVKLTATQYDKELAACEI